MDIQTLTQIVNLFLKVYSSTISVNDEDWLSMTEEDRQLTINGVNHIIADPDITPEQLHAIWVAAKSERGWRCGTQKNDNEKVHPCMCQYQSLPLEEQIKPRLFVAVVTALHPLLNNRDNISIPKQITNNFNIFQNG